MSFSFSRADWAVLGLCLVSVLGFLGSRDIDGIRERRLAATAADVDMQGRWLVPHLRDQPRFLKPPYADWLAVWSMRLLGRSEWSFRLPFALAGLGMVLLGWWLGMRLMGAGPGRVTALIMASSPWFVSECHSASQDVYLGLFTGLALASWWFWQQTGRPGSAAWWCFWLSLTLGCLFKGPVALAIVGIPILLELGASKRWPLVVAMRPWWGLAIILALVLPWSLVVYWRVPGFSEKLLADMQLALVRDQAELDSDYFNHLVHYWWLTFPYTVLGLGALGLPWLRRQVLGWSRLRFCYFWMMGNFLFFNLLAKQPIHYLLPIMIPVAVLEAALGCQLLEMLRTTSPDWRRRFLIWMLFLCSAGFAVATGMAMHLRAGTSRVSSMLTGLALLVPALLALRWVGSQPGRAARLWWLTVFGCVLVFSGWVMPARSQEKSCAAFAKELARLVPPNQPVYYLAMREEIPFYARRDFRRIHIPHAPAAAQETLSPLGAAYLLMNRGDYEDLVRRFKGQIDFPVVLEQKMQSDSPMSHLLVRLRGNS